MKGFSAGCVSGGLMIAGLEIILCNFGLAGAMLIWVGFWFFVLGVNCLK